MEKPPLSRRERSKADKLARILAAAIRRLGDDSYESMTMAEVARDADVAEGTVFQYASTKAELLMMVTAHRWRQLAEADRSAEYVGLDAAGHIGAILRPVVDEVSAMPINSMAIARELLFGADGAHRSEVLTIIEGAEEQIADVLVDAGAAPDRAEEAARLVVSGVLIEANRTRRHSDDKRSLAASVASVIDLTVTGALHGPPAAPPGATRMDFPAHRPASPSTRSTRD